jgi:hypothetical protein
VSQCITAAWKDHKPFFFAVDGSAIDSWVATGLMGTNKGAIKVFWYDSAPCGNVHCAEAFDADGCSMAETSDTIDPLMKCSDDKMPQPAAQQ